MSKFKIFLAAIAALAMATPALAVTFEVHGDLNNRFGLYTNQAQMYSVVENVRDVGAAIDEDDVEEFFADIKYRLNTTMATDDGAVKGVFAIEVGGIQFGQKAGGGGFSGDGKVVEVRKAYTDVQLPNTQSRLSVGLQALTVNKFVWWEMVPAVQLAGKAGDVGYKLAWARGIEAFNTSEDDDLFEDHDALLARVDLKPAEGTKLGLFALYQRADNLADGTDSDLGPFGYEIKNFGDAEYDIYTLGVDGGLTSPTGAGNFFVNWDLIYQGGEVTNDLSDDADVSGYLIHADVGANVGATRFTYTGWYASGDDDDADDDIENYLATDVDRADSIIFFEGGYTDDDYFTEAPYILNKGLILNKLAVDHKLSEQTSIGGALLYLMTAEDLELADGSKEDKLGTEVDVYVSHKLYDNVEVAWNFGYLFADDGMDFWEVQADGSSDSDVYRSTARIRYSF